MVRALFFDLGNVLVPFDYGRFYRRLEPHSSFAAEEIAGRFAASELPARYETGAISTAEFYEGSCRALGLEMHFASFAEAWSSIFDTSANFDAGFFRGLASRYTLVLLSNTNELHFEFISRQFPWVRLFHRLALSFRVGETKPGPAIYHAAVRMSGVQPGDAFYTDDIAEYVDAARALGINQSVLFTNPSLLIEEMAAAGVHVDGRLDVPRQDEK
ncbi:MAG TPA: HAD family phosphatase [Terriglobia bacterium]|nr:HAD family phosphatase [Terriglobia bacterium]